MAPDNMLQAIMPKGTLRIQLGIRQQVCCSLVAVVLKALNLALPLWSILLISSDCHFLLAINGTSVRTAEDVTDCFHFHLEQSPRP
jgi:hypothetical protein